MFDELVYLCRELRTVNEYGDVTVEMSERPVFADFKSIGMSEFYQANAAGMKPELKLVLPDYLEYQGEQKLRYAADGTNYDLYEIMRTYRTGDNLLELVCKRGVANASA